MSVSMAGSLGNDVGCSEGIRKHLTVIVMFKYVIYKRAH